MYCARSCASVRSSCASVGPYSVKLQEAATKRRLIAILVTHDVIDWLELCMCPLTVTFKYSRTKYSRMAADPRKPRTLNPAKIKAHTVLAKCPRGHVITGLLQFEFLLCRIITERTRPTFLWLSANAFLFGKNWRNSKACGIKSDLFVNNDFFQTGYELKTFSQHALGAESPSCLVSHSHTACAWRNPSGYVRLVISCLGGRKKRSTRENGFEEFLF